MFHIGRQKRFARGHFYQSSALLSPCEENPPITGGSPHTGPLMWNFDFFFVDCRNQLLHKQSSWGQVNNIGFITVHGRDKELGVISDAFTCGDYKNSLQAASLWYKISIVPRTENL